MKAEGQAAQLLLLIVLGQPRGGHAPAVQQQPPGVDPHGLRLHQHLGVVIVVFQPEHIHHPGIGGGCAQLLKGLRPGGGQHTLHILGPQALRAAVAALCEDLQRLALLPGVDHPIHPVPGQKPALHGVDPGGEG